MVILQKESQMIHRTLGIIVLLVSVYVLICIIPLPGLAGLLSSVGAGGPWSYLGWPSEIGALAAWITTGFGGMLLLTPKKRN